MKKLGLCVRYDCNNYGSMLQILATQKAINSVGWSYEIIRYDKKTVSFMIRNITRIFNPYFVRGKMMVINKRKKLRAYPEIKIKCDKRVNLFEKYRKEYIGPYSQVFRGFDNLSKGVVQYDAMMVGSDQLWTPAGIKSKFYNLLFVSDEIKKISLATSFGISKIPKNQIKETAKYLKRIEYLSVREKTGAAIVKRLTNRDVKVLLDPTLFFDSEEWYRIFPRKKMSDEPYVFAYFLGTNTKHRDIVNELVNETGMKIITCPQMDDFVERDINFGDEQRFDITPPDFLNLIRDAEYIFTDSYHGSVFSILNHKKFITFNRFEEGSKQSRNSRIDSLFDLLELQSRRYRGDIDKIKKILIQNIDYEEIDKKLKKLREEAFQFLNDALN